MAKILLESSIKSIENIHSHYQDLEKTGDFYLISTSLENIITNFLNVPGFKSNLKLILSSMVDSIYKHQKSQTVLENHSKNIGMASVSPISNATDFEYKKVNQSKSNSTKSFFKPDSPKLGKYASKSNMLVNEDFHLISEFSYIKGPSFNKQKRILGDNREKIPGPSDYYKNEDVCHTSSPKITMPKSPRNIEFGKSITPAPGYYNPIRYFSSR